MLLIKWVRTFQPNASPYVEPPFATEFIANPIKSESPEITMKPHLETAPSSSTGVMGSTPRSTSMSSSSLPKPQILSRYRDMDIAHPTIDTGIDSALKVESQK